MKIVSSTFNWRCIYFILPTLFYMATPVQLNLFRSIFARVYVALESQNSCYLEVQESFDRWQHRDETKREFEVPYIFHTVNERDCDVSNTGNCQKPIIRQRSMRRRYEIHLQLQKPIEFGSLKSYQIELKIWWKMCMSIFY